MQLCGIVNDREVLVIYQVIELSLGGWGEDIAKLRRGL